MTPRPAPAGISQEEADVTLTEFLSARLDEYEAALDDATSGPPYSPVATHGGAAVHAVLSRTDPVDVDRDVAWLRRDLASKRAMVREWQEGVGRKDEQGRLAHLFDPALSMLLKSHERWLRHMASVYSDHPDYRGGMEL